MWSFFTQVGLTKRGALPAALVLCVLGLSGCQSSSPGTTITATIEPVSVVYSGWFVWDSERELGSAAYQCMRVSLANLQRLRDGRLRFTGLTRYITGEERAIDTVDTEMVMDPATSTFVMRESNPSNADFVTEGRFEGETTSSGVFLIGKWVWDDREPDTRVQDVGIVHLRQGGDAPCTPDENT